VGQLQADIDSTLAAAHGGQQALSELKAGRLNTAKQWNIYDTAHEVFGKRDLTQIEPVGIQTRLTWGRDSGIEGLKKIAALAPDQMRQAGRAFIDSGGKWETLGAETRKVLFKDPQLIKDLDAYYAKKTSLGKLTDMEPVGLFDNLLRNRDATIQRLRTVAQEAPQKMPQLGRAFMQEILDRVFREGDIKHQVEALNDWDALGKEAKQILFRNPALINDLDNLMVSLKRLAAEKNPSGSGYMIQINRIKNALPTALAGIGATGGTMSGGIGGGLVGTTLGLATAAGLHVVSNAVLARMLFNPRFSSLLRQGIQFQLKGDRLGAGLASAQLVKMLGEDKKQADRPPLSSFDRR
jgi:hypothetical protein